MNIAEFWTRVSRSDGDGCWIWTGKKRAGYGRAHVGAGRCVSAHVLAWSSENGDVPAGMNVCHHCDNPTCVRPSHLFIGTQADNMKDAGRKRRLRLQRRPEETQGVNHPMVKLTEAQVREIHDYSGGLSQRALGERYGVTQGLVQQIRSGKIWRHLQAAS